MMVRSCISQLLGTCMGNSRIQSKCFARSKGGTTSVCTSFCKSGTSSVTEASWISKRWPLPRKRRSMQGILRICIAGTAVRPGEEIWRHSKKMAAPVGPDDAAQRDLEDQSPHDAAEFAWPTYFIGGNHACWGWLEFLVGREVAARQRMLRLDTRTTS